MQDTELDPLPGSPGENENRSGGIVSRQFFSGPLPLPSILREYNEIQPDFAERLLRLTEEEARHRHEITRRSQSMAAVETFIGQLFGLIVALSAFGASAWFAYLGHPVSASVIGGTTILGLVSVFVTGRRWRQSETDEGDEGKE